MTKTNAVVLTLAISCVFGCSRAPEPKSVRFYMENELLREDMIARCNDDGGRLRGSPDCRNASVASTRIAAKKDRETKAALAAASQRKLEAMRQREAAFQQQQQQPQVDVIDPAVVAEEPVPAVEGAPVVYGAPTGQPIVNTPIVDDSLPPVIGYETVKEGESLDANFYSEQTETNQTLPAQTTPEQTPVAPVVTQSTIPIEPEPQQQESWTVTPSQVQPSSQPPAPQQAEAKPIPVEPEPVVVQEQPAQPVRDPSQISLDDLPGAGVSEAGLPSVNDLIQEPDTEDDTGQQP